ncbi:acyltransferase [Aureicoccus marinus]|uniref:acyltransferase n=1 Tax=Aureicoccus marinus TaxID=754435 RepID=UPI0015E39786|nr:acyltransferase [Aureicoccus marinus]
MLRIQGKGRIQFGKNVKINSGKNYNIIGGDTRTALVVKKNARLVIGDNCGISNCSIVCHEFVQLGKDVKIGGGVKIYDTDFHQLDAHLRRDAKTDIGRTKPVFIDDDAFIGAHSIILKGSYVGKGAIIGAGSVVRGRVPDNEIWTGNPAKFVRKIH